MSTSSAFQPDQLAELAAIADSVEERREGGEAYVFLGGLHLPPGCSPQKVDALLAPNPRDGYPSRLMFALRISGAVETMNWASQPFILGRSWEAFSYRIDAPPGARLIAIASMHLKPFKRRAA